jgi:hypothetical protein
MNENVEELERALWLSIAILDVLNARWARSFSWGAYGIMSQGRGDGRLQFTVLRGGDRKLALDWFTNNSSTRVGVGKPGSP